MKTLCDTGLNTGDVQHEFDDGLKSAIDVLMAPLPEDEKLHVRRIIEDFEEESNKGPTEKTDLSRGDALIQPAGTEDAKYCQRDDQNLQAQLCALGDKPRLVDLDTKLRAANDCKASRRIRELRDPSVSHDWLWALNPAYGSSLSSDQFSDASRLRLGMPLFEGSGMCARCGDDSLDCFGSHCLRCALGQATRGHNQVRDEVRILAHLADPSAQAEPVNLISVARFNFFGHFRLAGGI